MPINSSYHNYFIIAFWQVLYDCRLECAVLHFFILFNTLVFLYFILSSLDIFLQLLHYIWTIILFVLIFVYLWLKSQLLFLFFFQFLQCSRSVLILLMLDKRVEISSLNHFSRGFVDFGFKIIALMLLLQHFLHHFLSFCIFIIKSLNFITNILFSSLLKLFYNNIRGHVDSRLESVLGFLLHSLPVLSFLLFLKKLLLPCYKIC